MQRLTKSLKFFDFILILFLIFFILTFNFYNFAQAAMSSDSYQIWADSFNAAGGEDATSDSYTLQDTMGEAGTGISSSDNYKIWAGFRRMTAEPIFSFSVSVNTCNLGTLSVTTVSSCSYVVTATTNAVSGYITTIIDDDNLRNGSNDIDNVTDGEVTAGAEEYGFRTSGADGQSNNVDTGITTIVTNVAQDATGPINTQQVTVEHRASITSTTKAGAYSHTVTLISTGAF